MTNNSRWYHQSAASSPLQRRLRISLDFCKSQIGAQNLPLKMPLVQNHNLQFMDKSQFHNFSWYSTGIQYDAQLYITEQLVRFIQWSDLFENIEKGEDFVFSV